MRRGWLVSGVVLGVLAGGGAASAASWKLQPAAARAGASANVLAGVSCLSVACTAVGWSTDPLNADQTLAERRQGATWTIQGTPNLAGVGGIGGDLKAVSCPGQRRCEAVGYSDAAIGNDDIIAGWNGTRWTMQRAPSPPDDPSNIDNPPNDFLNGVSCPRLNFCVAVGSYGGLGWKFPLTGRWNGKAWKPLPKARGSAGKQLNAVSCTGPNACIAVGGAIADRWNGHAWTIQSAAQPAGGSRVNLMGVACVSARRCVAVGTYRRGAQTTLAELWNGRKWSVLRTPGTGRLAGVSCRSAGRCVAVGATSGGPLAEGWNGSAWTILPTPTPAAKRSWLDAVSCTGPSACTAVGASDSGPLAMTYS